jgi:hypothetical protein
MSIRSASIPFAVAVLAGLLSAQARRGDVPKTWPEAVQDEQVRDPSRIVVKFVEGTAVRLRDGVWVGDPRVAGANAAISRGASRIERLFTATEAELDAERRDLLAIVPEAFDPPADLNNYYVVHAGDAAAGRALLAELGRLEVVETVYPEWRGPIPPPGDIPPVTAYYGGRQGHREAAPLGVDHAAGRVIPGGRGEDLTFIDVEYGWWLDHEDVRGMVQANVTTPMSSSFRDHGSAVVGEIAADWDRFGVTGLCDLSTPKMHSHLSAHTGAPIQAAASHVGPGDIIVLEMQINTPLGLGPVEYRQDVFDAIRNAVLAGKHVFEAAGNGGVDLDSPSLGGLFDRSQRDSGAVIVGATNGPTRTRASFSCHGSRIDACAWGGQVTTTGYGALFSFGTDHRQDYTASFNGTSSATPIVTGAAMAVLGAARTQLGRTLTPAELRALLWQHGTELPNQRIGRQPDARKLLAAVGLPKGLSLVDAGIGETMTVTLDAPAGAPFLIAVALGPGFRDLGPAGYWLLDATAVPAWGGVLPPGGTISFATAVPNDPLLHCKSLWLQAGWLDATAGLVLSSSVRNQVP